MIFDIGANYGTFTEAAVRTGHKVIAVEPAPRVFSRLVSSYIYTPGVVLVKMAVSNTNNETVEFYEAEEDGLSTLNPDWLTSDTMPYAGKPFRTIKATTITIDSLVELYGKPDLIKIDVEGGEWLVFKGMTKNYGKLTFEWTDATITDHEMQLDYLYKLGYKEYGLQYIVNYLDEPVEWYPLQEDNTFAIVDWVAKTKETWESGGWQAAGLRPTADVGMCWVR